MKDIPESVHSANVYTHGVRLLGTTGEVTLPNLEAMSETISGFGILGEYESPTPGHFGSLEQEIEFRTFDDGVFELLDAEDRDGIDLTLRAAQMSRASTGAIGLTGAKIVMRGMLKTFGDGTVKQASPIGVKIKLELLYYKLVVAGQERIELDKLNGIYKVNGVDRLAKVRSLT